ncbi:GNAT family N-acetyltransferase [Providencia stuartii]|nr:GNAT family N-acetyltransferase [Providencia stuartii]
MLQDTPEGNQRLTYALIDDGVVKGTVVFIFAPPLNGEHCFGMAYSVAENFRKQGVGSDLVKRCLEEFKSGMKGKVKSYYIEALVGTNNIPSQKIASKLLSQTPKQTTDKVSGLPALHYTRLFSYP